MIFYNRKCHSFGKYTDSIYFFWKLVLYGQNFQKNLLCIKRTYPPPPIPPFIHFKFLIRNPECYCIFKNLFECYCIFLICLIPFICNIHFYAFSQLCFFNGCDVVECGAMADMFNVPKLISTKFLKPIVCKRLFVDVIVQFCQYWRKEKFPILVTELKLNFTLPRTD